MYWLGEEGLINDEVTSYCKEVNITSIRQKSAHIGRLIKFIYVLLNSLGLIDGYGFIVHN